MNVLVVDDTKNIRLLLIKCLEMEGCHVKTADDGKSALSMLETERFDLVFLDIKMPMLSGTEVLRRMREMGVNTPVIIITAYATVKNAVDCTQLGAVAYLQKPFTAGKIRAVLGEIPGGKPAAANSSGPEKPVTAAKEMMMHGKYADAISILLPALSENPFMPELYELLSQSSEKLGRYADAKKYASLHDALLKEK